MRSRRYVPGVRGLEARNLESVIPILIHPVRTPAPAGPATASGDPAGGTSGASGAGASTGPASSGSGATALLQGTPTPHEQAREQFVARGFGPVLVGPPRFTDQARQFRITGRDTSSATVKGAFQMGLFPPADPATGRITGFVTLYDQGVTTSGSILGLDLDGDPAAVDRHGQPAHLTWTVDPGLSGGAFASATGQGTLDLRYRGRLAFVSFQGTVTTTGVTNILATPVNHRSHRLL
jgi:hypothetical protein